MRRRRAAAAILSEVTSRERRLAREILAELPNMEPVPGIERLRARMSRHMTLDPDAPRVAQPYAGARAARPAAARRGPRARNRALWAAGLAACAFAWLWRGSSEPAPRDAGDASNVYLGADDGAAADLEPFPGEVVWDDPSHVGRAIVAVLDLDVVPARVVSEDVVLETRWTPARPLPKRFRVSVTRAGDDGFGAVEVFRRDYSSH